MATRSNLAVILHADVVGSTALVHKDERVAHERIQNSFRRLSETINTYGGVTHEVRGDALVAVFGRASDGVSATLAFQVANTEQNAVLTDDIRVEIRVGIALGEVVVADNTVTGPGVVLAQRIEQLAGPGGLCISAAIHEAVPRRLPVEIKSLGDQSVKGFDEPVRVYSVSLRAGEKIPEPVNDIYSDDSEAKSSTPMLALPDKPSIAVLPFNNLSGDPEQEYFADGMTEDIITGLSRFRSLFVTARNSSFAYKGRSLDVREVARDLGVRYVLEGSVRRGGERIRITGQLIDAETGHHLWAERYDRKLEDIFAVQDEVTEAIVAAIAPEIDDVERERSQHKPPESLEAWDIYQQGLAAYHSSTEEGFGSAIEQFDSVNEIDPTFAPAYAMAAGARTRYVLHFEPDDRAEYLNEAREKAYKAITLDPRDPMCLMYDGRVHSMLDHHDVAISKVKEAIALNPNDALSHFNLGIVLCSAGCAEEAIPHIDHAMRLSPRDIFLTGMLTHRAFLLFDLERYEEAFEWVQRARLSPNPRSMTFALLTAVLTKLGRQEEARAAVKDLSAHAPGMSCVKYRENPFGRPEVMERFVDALREAGLPE
ncbi:MAG: adenylate/guanylate cyclase domain-containing protein [Alphaproteobacteria bacterium]|nr:adenylate/guanylate cyclase domain-containing protein [Alphaproteobacteria bacterium]